MQNLLHFTEDLDKSSKNPGFIYLTTTESYPNGVQVGCTKILPEHHVNKLSSSEAAMTPYRLYRSWVVYHCKQIMEKISDKMAGVEDTSNRLLIDISTDKAAQHIENCINDFYSITFKGCKFRKSIDVKWAVFYDSTGVPYEYITEPKKITHNIRILPDFWLPDQDCWVIIKKNFLSTNEGKMSAYCLARATGKVVLNFYSLKPPPEEDGLEELPSPYGRYVTPEGDFDSLIMWGSCSECGTKHLGHFGSSELCDSKDRNTSQQKCPPCSGGGVTGDILNAYDFADSFF